mmetsp:Transcript_10109/g.29922  ORF Transcript_10109/g.29922 Transcript_10109/m.29922 type:complete len:274 (-) Transcript_10109:259-1080(-)
MTSFVGRPSGRPSLLISESRTLRAAKPKFEPKPLASPCLQESTAPVSSSITSWPFAMKCPLTYSRFCMCSPAKFRDFTASSFRHLVAMCSARDMTCFMLKLNSMARAGALSMIGLKPSPSRRRLPYQRFMPWATSGAGVGAGAAGATAGVGTAGSWPLPPHADWPAEGLLWNIESTWLEMAEAPLPTEMGTGPEDTGAVACPRGPNFAPGSFCPVASSIAMTSWEVTVAICPAIVPVPWLRHVSSPASSGSLRRKDSTMPLTICCDASDMVIF